MEKLSIEQLYTYFQQCNEVTTDSRNTPINSLFFALKGGNFNGNRYAEKALEAGSRFAVIDEPAFAVDERYLLVEDVLTTLQQLATHHRKQLTIPIIGITGTNGKTTTKELTHAVLKTEFNTLATEGNLNNHIGVPLTLLKIKPTHEIAIIEMGANHLGEIKQLCEIAQPNFGLITNVGKAHLEGFGSFEGVIKTKTELYEWLRESNGTLFFHNENEYLKPYIHGIRTILYGELPNCYLRGEMTGCSPFIEFRYLHNESNIAIKTKLIGSYNLTNLLAATTIGTFFGITPEHIKQALENYEPTNKRSQLVETKNNSLILDAYNANPSSMRAALANFKAMEVRKKLLILGDMRELGEESNIEHQHLLAYISELGFEEVILVGDQFNALPHHFIALKDAQELQSWLSKHPVTGYFILIKGSRGIALETGIDYL